MSFNWAEYLTLAQELTGAQPAAPAGAESRARSAISRAYYAAFVKARNHLRDKDHDAAIPRAGQAHDYIRYQFRRSRDPRRKRVAALLNSLRLIRNQADYDDVMPYLARSTQMALTQAAEVLAILARL